ncbi:MAG: PASTA domain-containing protein, partial [Nonomuraea sp.]|nr:PASTA domain-containing protein [Nonomuraea sp.]
GTSVALTVARNGVAVPSVVGRARADGRAALVAAGFTVRARGQIVDDESQVGTVVSQSVAPGTCADPGQVVVIVVGVEGQTGPGPEEGTPTPTPPVAGE